MFENRRMPNGMSERPNHGAMRCGRGHPARGPSTRFSPFPSSIKALGRAQGLSLQEIADKSGVSRQSLYYWGKGRTPELSSLRKVAEVLNTSVQDLEADGKVFAKNLSSTSGSAIPHNWRAVPRVRFEFDADANPKLVEEKEDILLMPDAFFRRHRVSPASCLAAEVGGDSMTPTLLPGDTVVFVRKTDPCAIQDGAVYVFCDGAALRIRRLSRQVDGGLLIRSDNAVYSPESLPANGQEHVRIFGRVVWASREF